MKRLMNKYALNATVNRIEHFADLAFTTPITIDFEEGRSSTPIDATKFFTSTDIEELVYSVVVPNPIFVSMVTLDPKSGSMLVRSRGQLTPGQPGVSMIDGQLTSTYNFDVYATNQWKKRSPPARVTVKEVYIQPPVVVSSIPTVNLNELQTSQTIDIARYFSDPQNRALTFSVSSSRSNNNFTYDTNTRVFTVNRVASLSEPLVNYTLRFTASNGPKTVSTDVSVRDEFILPPVLTKSFPTGITFVRGSRESVTVNLNEHFQDAPHNASLLVTQGKSQTLAFSVIANPASMQSAVTLSGATLTVRTLGMQQAYTVTVTATNASKKMVTGNMSIQDTQPINCQVSEWGAWGACSASCGGGSQTRTRTMTVTAQNGGSACPNLSESQSCNTHGCPVNCEYSLTYGSCNSTCGSGSRQVSVNVTRWPQNGGAACPNSWSETCWLPPCPPPPPYVPPPPPDPLPPGSYRDSCRNCTFFANTLSCICKNGRGGEIYHSSVGWCHYANLPEGLRC